MMDVASISHVLPVESSGTSVAGLAGKAPADEPFGTMVADLLKDIQGQHATMNNQITDLALGKTDNLHQVVVNIAETDLMFRMLMEVRDKLISSYQEIMRMQI
jgi:flagellar hook-basal body complex protein FliE